jgi:hypothetical protein
LEKYNQFFCFHFTYKSNTLFAFYVPSTADAKDPLWLATKVAISGLFLFSLLFVFFSFSNNHSDVKVASQTDIWTDLLKKNKKYNNETGKRS